MPSQEREDLGKHVQTSGLLCWKARLRHQGLGEAEQVGAERQNSIPNKSGFPVTLLPAWIQQLATKCHCSGPTLCARGIIRRGSAGPRTLTSLQRGMVCLGMVNETETRTVAMETVGVLLGKA